MSSALKCGFYYCSGLVRPTDQEMIVSEKFVTHSSSGERCRPCHTGPHGEALGWSKGRGKCACDPYCGFCRRGQTPLLLAAQPLAGSQMCSTTCLGHPRPPVSPHACSAVQSRRSMLPEPGCSLGEGLRQCGFSIQQHLPTRLCGSQQTLVDTCKQVSKPLGDSMR